MAKGKWIRGLTADTPVSAAAAEVLAVRLAVVMRYFPLAARQPWRDDEYVHQLRVATRRSQVALDLFEDWLGRRHYRRVRRLLRRIRRRAGRARDCDVFLRNLEQALSRCKAGARPGLHFVAGQIASDRQAAQVQLGDFYDRTQATVKDRFDKLVRSVRKGPRRGKIRLLGELGRCQLAARLDQLQESLPGQSVDMDQLHRLRIAGKRLRYALEVFAPCYPRELRTDLYPRVEQLQEVLGAINDHHTASQRLHEMGETARRFHPAWWKHWRSGVTYLIGLHRRELRRQLAEFRRFWKAWHRDRVVQRLREYLE